LFPKGAGERTAILDTNLVIDIFNGYTPVKDGLAKFQKEEFKIAIFTKYEVLRGTTGANELKTRVFLDTFGLCDFNEAAMEESIAAYKRPASRGIDEVDLLIFGISKAHGERLITRDVNLGRLGENVVVIKA
jgi:predicted nucleic acid-binding protein